MNKQDLKTWILKIQKMTLSELIRFEQRTLELSPIDGRAKEFLIKAVNLRRDTVEVISPMAVTDFANGELS